MAKHGRGDDDDGDDAEVEEKQREKNSNYALFCISPGGHNIGSLYAVVLGGVRDAALAKWERGRARGRGRGMGKRRRDETWDVAEKGGEGIRKKRRREVGD